MTDPTPPAPTVDDLKKKLDPILVKIRSLRAEVDTLEHQTRQRLMAVQSMVQNGIPMQIGSEVLPKALAIIGDNTQAIIRLKTRIQFLGKFKGKLKGQISALTGETLTVEYDGGVDALAAEKAAVAGLTGSLLE